MNDPATPITYASLQARFGFTAVTLRNKPSIRAAMEKARLTATQFANETEKCSSTEDARSANNVATIERLRKELQLLKLEVENYRRDHQLLSLHFLMEGKQMSQILAQASLNMSGKQTPGTKDGNAVNPVSRK